MRCAIYSRFSSENQKDSSIEDQQRNCEQRAEREGWSITHRYADRAISGSVTDRPQYQQMLADAKAKAFDALLVDDLSRLSRDTVEVEQVRRRFVHWGLRLIGISDGIDTLAKGHKILSSVKGIMNEVFLDDLRDKTRRGMVGQVLKGYHGGGRSFGYNLVPEYDGTKKDPYGQPVRIGTRLEIDAEQAKWVRWIFEQYADDVSPLRIVEELNRKGVRPPGMFYKRRTSLRPSWCNSALYGSPRFSLGLLNNSLYKGELIWGRSRWEKDPDTKKKRRFLTEEKDWVRVPAEHLRIVSDELWNAVKRRQRDIHQASHAIRSALHATARTGRGPKFLLSSVLVCAECGHRFIIASPSSYACSGWKYRGQAVCTNNVLLLRSLVEKAILDTIKSKLFCEEALKVYMKEWTRLLAERKRANIPALAEVKRRLVEVEQEIENLLNAIRQGIITPSTKSALEAAEAERENLSKQLSGQRQTEEKVLAYPQNLIKRFETMLDDVMSTQYDVNKARGIVKQLVGGSILLHPKADGAEKYLEAELRGDYAMLTALATSKNKYGGGHGS